MPLRLMRGVFLDTGSIGPGELDLRPLTATLPEWTTLEHTTTAGIIQAIRNTQVVVTNKVCLDRDTLKAAEAVKLICIAATGTNNIDLACARERNIAVCNVRAYATTSVVEHVFSMILALTRHHHEYRVAIDAGNWQQADSFSLLSYPIRELAGQTLGIIGYGELGKAVATLGKAFGMQVLIAQRPGTDTREGRIPLEQILSQATIISLHCPLTTATRNLIDREEFRAMRADALLINTARGGIVNEAALSEALRTGQIAGAAIDVLSEEPPRHGNPLLDPTIPNLIVTPHIAWAGLHARQTLINEIAANVLAYLKGTPQNLVTEQLIK